MKNEYFHDIMKESALSIKIAKYDFYGIKLKALNLKGIQLLSAVGLLKPLFMLLIKLDAIRERSEKEEKISDDITIDRLSGNSFELITHSINLTDVFKMSVIIAVAQDDEEVFDLISNSEDSFDFLQQYADVFFQRISEEKHKNLDEIYEEHFMAFFGEWFIAPLSNQFQKMTLLMSPEEKKLAEEAIKSNQPQLKKKLKKR